MFLSAEQAQQRRQRGQALLRAGNDNGLPPLRVHVLSTFTADFLPPFLVDTFAERGLWPEVQLGPFGQVAQEALNPQSALYRSTPDLIVMILAVEDLLAPLFARPAQLSETDSERLVASRAAEVKSWLEVLLQGLPGATIMVVPIGASRVPGPHVLRSGGAERGEEAVRDLLAEMRRLEMLSPRVVTVGFDDAAHHLGWQNVADPRLWYLARSRLNPVGWAALAQLVGQYWQAARGPARKIVAVDLDSTLWGGVVGEVGLSGLTLGDEGVGLAFQDVQRELLKWNDSGTLLAICSKNNPDDAWAVFDEHPAMVLKREHFAAARINWTDKATNLRDMAEELNLGLDSFVFLDDNPVEREWVRQALPEVLVPELPHDPVFIPEFLRRCDFVQRIAVTDSDRQRLQSYRVAAERNQLRTGAKSFDEFLASLDQQVTIAPVNAATLGRAAQLCQRTNQFNLTTRRYGVAELEQMMADPARELFTMAARDRFEDSGITGFASLVFANGGGEDKTAEIDTLLMSCRVLGRRLEDVLLAFLVSRARQRGATRIVGRYLATAKNGQVESFFAEHGFDALGDGLFARPLADAPSEPAVPTHITLHTS